MEPTTKHPLGQNTLSELLHRLARTQPEAEALVYPAFALGGRGIRRSFAELEADVDALARGLVAAGVGTGEHVAVWATNVPAWIPLEFALARIGAVLVTVNTSLQRDEVAYVLRQSHSVAVLHATCNGTTQSSETVDTLIGEGKLPDLRLRVWLPATAEDVAPAMVSPEGGQAIPLDQLLARGDTLDPASLLARETTISPTDLVNIQYTSGTTGFPKGVMLSHRNVLSSAYSLGQQMNLTPEDRIAVMVPLFHCFGCVVAVLGAFTHGASLHCIPGFEPGDALRLLHEERCTIILGVPTMFGAMLAHPERTNFDASSLRCGLAAGAPCPVPLMKRIRDELPCAGISVAYGLTEASPGVSGCHTDDSFEDRSETIGRPLAGVEVRIADPAMGAEVPLGDEGEILVKGDNVMLGYHDEPEATAAAITPDGWLRTGDLGRRDDRGFLRVVGRLKDIIIRGGENIAPAEIENLLREHPDILDAAVVGLPDERFGEEVAAALVLNPGASCDESAYTPLLAGRLASFKHPKSYHVFDAFPLTGSGKVKKFQLVERISAGR
jgi:fatty-acyl-CoA synthase